MIAVCGNLVHDFGESQGMERIVGKSLRRRDPDLVRYGHVSQGLSQSSQGMRGTAVEVQAGPKIAANQLLGEAVGEVGVTLKRNSTGICNGAFQLAGAE
jgi:hypothetical protein